MIIQHPEAIGGRFEGYTARGDGEKILRNVFALCWRLVVFGDFVCALRRRLLLVCRSHWRHFPLEE